MEVTKHISSPTAFDDVECRALYDKLLCVRPGGIVVEIGCQLGRSSSIIAQLQPVCQYHAIHIDPYTDQPGYLMGWMQKMFEITHPTEHEFALMCMRTEQADWLFSRLGELDLVLIDGDHEHHAVHTDLWQVADNLRRGGYLLAHDYERPSLPDVKRAVDEFLDMQWHPIGVFGSLGVWLRK